MKANNKIEPSNNQIKSFDIVLDQMFGPAGSKSRAIAEEKAYAFYSGQIIETARKKKKITQSELAERVCTSKTYISRVENGYVDPKFATFQRIMNALGYSISFTAL